MSKKMIRFVNGGHVEIDYDAYRIISDSGIIHFMRNNEYIFSATMASILYFERKDSIEYFPPPTPNINGEMTS